MISRTGAFIMLAFWSFFVMLCFSIDIIIGVFSKLIERKVNLVKIVISVLSKKTRRLS